MIDERFIINMKEVMELESLNVPHRKSYIITDDEVLPIISIGVEDDN